MNRLPLIALGCCSVFLSGAALADAGHSKSVDYRNAVMTVLEWNMKPMGAMLKGKIPYDKEAFARHARDLSAAARLDLMAGFPEGSDESEDSSARMDIWMDWKGFEDKYANLKQAARELDEVSGSGDRKLIAPKFGALGKTCKACHDAFKD